MKCNECKNCTTFYDELDNKCYLCCIDVADFLNIETNYSVPRNDNKLEDIFKKYYSKRYIVPSGGYLLNECWKSKKLGFINDNYIFLDKIKEYIGLSNTISEDDSLNIYLNCYKQNTDGDCIFYAESLEEKLWGKIKKFLHIYKKKELEVVQY